MAGSRADKKIIRAGTKKAAARLSRSPGRAIHFVRSCEVAPSPVSTRRRNNLRRVRTRRIFLFSPVREGCPSEQSLSAAILLRNPAKEKTMNQLIYLVGLVVVVIAILSFFGFA
ncbi:hypothetical protein [Ciceribacter thiooxidans]|uniref:Uncharacterized protein n=1 Tax=Ciceribacter thiooxidans TaxID=1969821 RepID=A0ABV7HZZ8_9HYPH|nr:hypothetical protein [Ciceribacter thiooxidans]